MLQRRTRVFIGVLGLVLIAVGVGDFGHAARFKILAKDPDWVLDSTTSLQWQRMPGGSSMPTDTALAYCTNLGNGARLPEIKELYSLVDYNATYPGPFLPAGHPFLNVQTTLFYWSATQLVGYAGQGFYVDFSRGQLFGALTSTNGNVWCVR